MPFYTPLRYPGGKRKLAPFLEELIRLNELGNCTYIEPYAGGAGLALHLLFNHVVSKIIINDIDRSIFAFWYSVLHYPDELCRMIHDTPVTMDVWHVQKAVQMKPNNFSLLELGFSTFLLNRTNRSGILCGGVIGGKKQSGLWKMDDRFKKDELIARIQAIANLRDHITLYNKDALDFLDMIEPTLSPLDSLIYLDPPYYKKGSGLYRNSYTPEDHKAVANRVFQIHSPWIVSYDNEEPIRTLYSNLSAITYSLNYTAQQKTMGSEFMAFSTQLRLPDFSSRTFPLMHNIRQLKTA